MKPLSEQLAELSVRAKGAEKAFEGAKNEARDKIEARKAEALSAVKTAVEKMNQKIKSAGESATRDTKALQAKITADVNTLKAHVLKAKHGLDVKLAEKNAELLEEDAGFAIDYAIASWPFSDARAGLPRAVNPCLRDAAVSLGQTSHFRSWHLPD